MTTLFDLDFENKLGKYTAYGFYNDGTNEITDVISGSAEFVRDGIFTMMYSCDGLCFTLEQGDLEETTDTDYHIENMEE